MAAEMGIRPSRPRVLLVIPSLDYGGAERQVSLLAAALHTCGWPVQVATFQPGGVFRRQLEKAGVPVLTFPRRGLTGMGSIMGLMAQLRRFRPQVIHAFLWSANFRSRLAGLILPGTPCIISLRGFDDDLNPGHRLADRLLDRRITAVVSNCLALQQDARSRGLGRLARHEVIYNGLVEEPSSPEVAAGPGVEVATPSFQLGFIGRLERKKNPLALVPVLQALVRRRPGLQAAVIGGGQLQGALQDALQASGLQENVTLMGYQEDVRPWYRRIGVLVNTSLSEGCCNVILEAMRAGVPVVATAVGGNTETVADGKTGLLVPAGDAQAMATAVATLLDDPVQAHAMGQAGQRRVQQQFSVTAMVEAYARLYRQLAPAADPATASRT